MDEVAQVCLPRHFVLTVWFTSPIGPLVSVTAPYHAGRWRRVLAKTCTGISWSWRVLATGRCDLFATPVSLGGHGNLGGMAGSWRHATEVPG